MPPEFKAGALTPEAARLIREEHAQLRALLQEIQSTEKLDALAPLLEKLRGLLGPHFEHEEMPDSLGVASTEPRLETRVDELFQEHREFLERLDDVIRKAHVCLEGPEAVIRSVADLTHALHEHEVKENELMIDLADTDLGGRG